MDQPTNRNFKLIKGGCDDAADRNAREFVSAYVTDTRLMGVVGLYIHWIISGTVFDSSIHQFFYFDAEEFGLENYQSLVGDDAAALAVLEKTIIGGLGGKKMDLSEDEARFLLQDFAADTKKLRKQLPEGYAEYGFILETPVSLSGKERMQLARKLCTPIESDYQLVHYFLIRTFGRDKKGVFYLTAPGAKIEEIAELRLSTLCKNTIEEFVNPSGEVSYLSESLIETGSQYKLIVSEITVKDGLVKSARRQSAFPVSVAEVTMMLSRPEFITVFEIIAEPDEFDMEFAVFSAGCMMTPHENGRLFMEFNRNNDHVNQRIFRLNDDIYGMYYVTDFGQLIAGAYSLEAIRQVEAALQKSSLSALLLPTAKYEFKEPVMYEFIQSGFEDFDDFLDSLQIDD